jgi:hypothetical protein
MVCYDYYLTFLYILIIELNILQNIGQSWIFLVILFLCAGMQAIICELGGYFGFGTYGLTWQEWLISIGLGATAVPLGFILRFIPVPKKGFCGFNVPDISFRAIQRRIRGLPAETGPVPIYIVKIPQPVDMEDIMAGPVHE